jgi:cyclopropane fatty-acyl-phospholipid synthase-like methyltransferase
MKLFDDLKRISRRPEPFAYYTSPQLWNDPHISKGMLKAHLDPDHDAASFRREFIDTAVDWMALRFRLSEETRICDFGCGPGLWTSRFAEKDAMTTGVDLSERSIRYAEAIAKEKNLAIRYILQDYLQFSTDDRFHLMTLIAGDFSVLSPDQSKALLSTFRTLLCEDGAVLLDVASMQRFHEATEKIDYEFCAAGGFWSPRPHHVFTSRFKYEPEHLLCDKYTVVEKDRELEIYNWTQCYSIESIKKVFEDNGLRVVECFSDVAGAPLQDHARGVAVVAMKSGESGRGES